MPSRTLLVFRFTRDIIYKLALINSHARCHFCSTYVSVSPLARRRARMKLTEIKKTRSSLRCSHFPNRNYPTVAFVLSKISAVVVASYLLFPLAGTGLATGKPQRVLHSLSTSLFHSSSPLVLLRLLFSHSLSQFAFAGHGDTRKSRFTVACHKGCFVAKAARGRQGEGGRESMRMKDERGGPLGEKERTELGMKIAGQTLDFRCTRTIRYCTLQRAAVTARSLVLYWSPQGSQKIASAFFFI